MGDVVPLRATLTPVRPCNQSFLLCSCSPVETMGWVPVISVYDDAGWYIRGLLCLGCEREIRIEGGRQAK